MSFDTTLVIDPPKQIPTTDAAGSDKSWNKSRIAGSVLTVASIGGAVTLAKLAGDLSQTGLIGLAVAVSVVGAIGIALFVSSFFGRKEVAEPTENQFTIIPTGTPTDAQKGKILEKQTIDKTPHVDESETTDSLIPTTTLVEEEVSEQQENQAPVADEQPSKTAADSAPVQKSTSETEVLKTEKQAPKKSKRNEKFKYYYPEKTTWEKGSDFAKNHPYLTGAAIVGTTAALALGGYYLLAGSAATTATATSTALVTVPTALETCAVPMSTALVTTSKALVPVSTALVTTSKALVPASTALVTTSKALVPASTALVTTSKALVPASTALVTTSKALVPASTALVTTSKALVAAGAVKQLALPTPATQLQLPAPATQLQLPAPATQLRLPAPDAPVVENMHEMAALRINQTPTNFTQPAAEILNNDVPPATSSGYRYLDVLSHVIGIGSLLLNSSAISGPVRYMGPHLKMA